jgi:hypothetical protein
VSAVAEPLAREGFLLTVSEGTKAQVEGLEFAVAQAAGLLRPCGVAQGGSLLQHLLAG